MIDELRSRPPLGADCVPSRVRRVGVKAGEAAIFHGRDRPAASNTEAAIPVNALYAGVISHIGLRPSYSDTHRYAVASSGVASLTRPFLFVSATTVLGWPAVYPSPPPAPAGRVRARLQRVAAGEVEIELPFREDLTQHHGYIAGPVLTAIVDVACGYAAKTLTPSGASVLTIEYKVNFLSPAQGERMLARGRVVRPGRSVTVCSGDAAAIIGENEKVVATMLATMASVGVQSRDVAPPHADVTRAHDRHVAPHRSRGSVRARVVRVWTAAAIDAVNSKPFDAGSTLRPCPRLAPPPLRRPRRLTHPFRSVILIIATALLSLNACSFVPLLQVQT